MTLPEGFRYLPELLSAAEEPSLLRYIEQLPFREFEFHGFLAKRRTVSYGWHYDFGAERLQAAAQVPVFLYPLRALAAEFAGVSEAELPHVLLTEYRPGAAIGWHRDKGVFDDVIGISLLSACRFRFRRQLGGRWERASLTLDPRSVYLLRGPSRTEWEHSIPAMDALRYSITFRSLRRARPDVSRTGAAPSTPR